MRANSSRQQDFEIAMGEEFGVLVSPPVPFFEAAPHECCEAIWLAFGREVTPTDLANASASQLERLAKAFGTYFECEAPLSAQLAEAIARTVARWPPGSIDE